MAAEGYWIMETAKFKKAIYYKKCNFKMEVRKYGLLAEKFCLCLLRSKKLKISSKLKTKSVLIRKDLWKVLTLDKKKEKRKSTK